MAVKYAADIDGRVAPGFERVKDAFAANFARGDAYQDLGAALCVHHRGACVVDLWGGLIEEGRAWRPDTLVNVWSTTKGLAAVCIAKLVERGAISYSDPVASVWPEFAANNKHTITIAQVMRHEAGLTGFVEPTTFEDFRDQALCAARLARQAPAFPPGSANSYHAATYGFLTAEIVRRADGRSIGVFAREEITGPLKADFFIGLPAELEPRVAPVRAPLTSPEIPALPDAALMALINPNLDPLCANSRAWRAAEIPAMNGMASARGVAALYNGLLTNDVLNAAALAQMTEPGPDRADMMLGFPACWGMGVAHNKIGVYGPNPHAYGHSGWGGSFGCADPGAQIAIGYVLNQMGADLVGDPRGVTLANAVHACLT